MLNIVPKDFVNKEIVSRSDKKKEKKTNCLRRLHEDPADCACEVQPLLATPRTHSHQDLHEDSTTDRARRSLGTCLRPIKCKCKG